MAFDGLSWYRLKRPVTQEEQATRLLITRPCSAIAKDGNTVFSMSQCCLEISDGKYWDKGRGLLALLLPGTFSIAGAGLILWMMTHVPTVYRARGELGFVYGTLSFFLVVMLCFVGLGVWGLTRECFRYTYNPIRLNRANRTVYVFRRNGPGGVLSVPWDKAFFYVERKPRAGLMRTAPRVVRCLVLDDNGRVIDTFSVGKRLVLAFDEDSAPGRLLMDELHQYFEYYRRFMEEGPSSVPTVTEFLSRTVSFRNTLKLYFSGVADIAHSRHPLLWSLFLITAIPTFMQATMHYLTQLTCREPVWPEAVERACGPTATEAEGLAS
ncbi:hypothetical protein GWC77_25075 [Paraburkholderia sp. NMBU_R16]|uniref:DUF6708 domain-containing protein n=1 Tax=Paraburkholderia sp. NMBU_R16 TaxID=2698676 RepID=UPI0015666B92|nr:DUF6708 domain-containing protein [Paraburkholderia sp. NMBU_R16]NRO99173.1 hypothetical protein [Paraburkholderia sp. NMBU_R16]